MYAAMISLRYLLLFLFVGVVVSCTKEGDTVYVTSPVDAAASAPLVTVVYDPDALGDCSFNDLIYVGVERAALEYGLRTMHLSPSTREEGLACLENFVSRASTSRSAGEASTPDGGGQSESIRRLLIVASNGYDQWVRQNNRRLESDPYTDLLYLETPTPLDGKGSTIYMPYYGAMYEAGAIMPHFSSEVLLVGANPEGRPVAEAMQGFQDGYATSFFTPYIEKILYVEYIGQQAGEGYSIADSMAMRMITSVPWQRKGSVPAIVPICGGAGRTFQRLSEMLLQYLFMGVDVERVSPNTQQAAVKHVDRAVEQTIGRWLSPEGMPKHQSLGLASGYTEVLLSPVVGVFTTLTYGVLDDGLRKTIHEEAIIKEEAGPHQPPPEGEAPPTALPSKGVEALILILSIRRGGKLQRRKPPLRGEVGGGLRLFCLKAALLALLAVVVGCRQEDDTVVTLQTQRWVEKTVAVVAPLSQDNMGNRLERTAKWFLDNLELAQAHDTLCIRLRLEWYDELTEDLPTLAATLAGRDDITAIVGPFSNDGIATFAPACQKTLKPLIAPTATSEDVVRRYAVMSTNGITQSQPFLWTLTQSDVALTETLLSSYATYAQYHDYKDAVAWLYTPRDTYGQTFNYWGPFFAENYSIRLLANEQYDSGAQLADLVEEVRRRTGGDLAVLGAQMGAFCVVHDVRQMYDVASRRREQMCLEDDQLNDDPFDESNVQLWQYFVWKLLTYFALPELCEEHLTALGERAVQTLQGYEGFSPYADPTTGFEHSYTLRFGVMPAFSECKLYDALMLTAFAASRVEHTQGASLNAAIIEITSASGSPSGSGAPGLSSAAWSPTAMATYLSALERGQLLKFKGASGEIAFDSDTYTAATQTTYVQWRILERQIQHTGYIGGSGSRRVSNNLSAWNFLYDKNRAEQDFAAQSAQSPDISYPELDGQYAVLVQGSYGFKNYRHLSDVLSVYQLLRQGGFPDDHIILVADQATAREAGAIRSTLSGPDLYGGTTPGSGLAAAVVDYDNATLAAADISNILLGQPTDSTPVVLPPGGGHNVFLYWSGHGQNSEFSWRDAPQGQGFTSNLLKQTAQKMLDQGAPTCRKLFVVAEPCYGEGVVRALDGIVGALGMSGASATEQSWADNWSNADLVWLSDRFTQNFITCLSGGAQGAKAETPTYRELFLYCAEHTLGSHAKIVNARNFGNLTVTNPGEFVRYNK